VELSKCSSTSGVCNAEGISERDLQETICHLTIKEILAEMKGKLMFTTEERRRKNTLIERIVQSAAATDLQKLHDAGSRKKVKGSAGPRSGLKRKRTETNSEPHAGQSIVDEDEMDTKASCEYLQLPTEAQKRKCHRQFLEATSNAAVELCICGVCARECGVVADSVLPIPLSLLPNSARLIPQHQHTAHDLYDGRLLEPTGLVGGDEDPIVNVCHQCLEELKKPGHKPPKMSLANDLWIGRTPWPLQVLTFPEQLLIALLYPRVYVFKLFPKCQKGTCNMESMQRAIRGNVSTYELDSEGIASMVEGNLMPRPPAILASLISVTFIAIGEMPRNWLHSTFRVRRKVVWDALHWLQDNNTKYYRNIQISSSRIGDLPENDVPEEIMALIRQSEDIGVLDEENDTYVPLDDDEGWPFTDTMWLHTHRGPQTVMPSSRAEESDANNEEGGCSSPYRHAQAHQANQGQMSYPCKYQVA